MDVNCKLTQCRYIATCDNSSARAVRAFFNSMHRRSSGSPYITEITCSGVKPSSVDMVHKFPVFPYQGYKTAHGDTVNTGCRTTVLEEGRSDSIIS